MTMTDPPIVAIDITIAIVFVDCFQKLDPVEDALCGGRLSLHCSNIVNPCGWENAEGGELGGVAQREEDLAAFQSAGVFGKGSVAVVAVAVFAFSVAFVAFVDFLDVAVAVTVGVAAGRT